MKRDSKAGSKSEVGYDNNEAARSKGAPPEEDARIIEERMFQKSEEKRFEQVRAAKESLDSKVIKLQTSLIEVKKGLEDINSELSLYKNRSGLFRALKISETSSIIATLQSEEAELEKDLTRTQAGLEIATYRLSVEEQRREGGGASQRERMEIESDRINRAIKRDLEDYEGYDDGYSPSTAGAPGVLRPSAHAERRGRGFKQSPIVSCEESAIENLVDVQVGASSGGGRGEGR